MGRCSKTSSMQNSPIYCRLHPTLFHFIENSGCAGWPSNCICVKKTAGLVSPAPSTLQHRRSKTPHSIATYRLQGMTGETMHACSQVRREPTFFTFPGEGAGLGIPPQRGGRRYLPSRSLGRCRSGSRNRGGGKWDRYEPKGNGERGRDVNMIIRACAVYCDILFYKIFADEIGCFCALSPNPWDGVQKHRRYKIPQSFAAYTLHSFTSLRIPVVPGGHQTASV